MQAWIQLTACSILFASIECLRVTNCPSKGEVAKDRDDFFLNCLEYSGLTPIAWSAVQPAGGVTAIGTCNTSSCSLTDTFVSQYFDLRWISASSCRLDFKADATATPGDLNIFICRSKTQTTVEDNCTIIIVEPKPEPDCSFCQCSGCSDTGGCWGCIVLIIIVVIIIACLCCWILYRFRRHRCACCGSCFSCLDSLFKSCMCCKCCGAGCACCCGIKDGHGNRPSPDGGDKPDPRAPSEDLPLHSNGTEPTSTPNKPPEPSDKSPGKKRSRRAAENSEMSPERGIHPSPEHDVKSSSPPAKTSRDLPQPNVPKEPNSKAPSVVLSPLTNTTTPPTLPSVEKTSFRKLPLPDIGNAKI